MDLYELCKLFGPQKLLETKILSSTATAKSKSRSGRTFCVSIVLCQNCFMPELFCVGIVLCQKGVRIYFVSKIFCVRTVLYQNCFVSELFCVRTALCQNCFVSELFCVRTKRCQNLFVSECRNMHILGPYHM